VEANDLLFGRRRLDLRLPGSTRLVPYTDSGFWRVLNDAATKAAIGRIGTHTFRHTYRSWLDAVGTPIAVQQKMMRHADVRTTLNIYGDVVTDEMEQAHRKVVGLALNGPVRRL
jgi:integrase